MKLHRTAFSLLSYLQYQSEFLQMNIFKNGAQLWLLLITIIMTTIDSTLAVMDEAPLQPLERIFEIPNDNCQMYAVPPGQKNALIYEDVLETSRSASGDNVSAWRQTKNKKLPILCIDSGSQDTSFLYYFGTNFMKGSVVCLDMIDGVKSLSPFVLDQIQDDKEAQTIWLYEQLNKAPISIILHPRQFDISFLIFQKQKTLNGEILKNIDNPYKYLKVGKRQQQFMPIDQYVRRNIDPKLPQMAFMFTVSPVLKNTKVLKNACLQVSQNDTQVASNYGKLVSENNLQSWNLQQDMTSQIFVSNKVIGCMICPAGSFSYLSKPDGSKFVMQQDFKQDGSYIYSNCQGISQEDAMPDYAVGKNYFYTYLEEDEDSPGKQIEKPCYLKLTNCAVCGGNAGNFCQLCYDGYKLVNITNDKGEIQAICIQICPQGQREVMTFTGMEYCEPCQMANCQTCNNIKLQENKEVQICLSCDGGYVLNEDKTECIDIMTYSNRFLPIIKTYDFIIQPIQIHPKDLSPQNLSSILANETTNNFIFIQQAIHKIYATAPSQQYVNATIWLVKGSHFFFHCNELQSETSLKTNPLREQAYCQLQSMQAKYPSTDNVDLRVKALRCDSIEAQNLVQSRNDSNWFQQNCVRVTDAFDERPVVFINSNEFYFNVTKTALFEDIIFDGINQFANYFLADYQAGINGLTELQPIHWPLNFCELDVPSDLNLKNDSSMLLQITQHWKDYYSYGQLPIKGKEFPFSLLFDKQSKYQYYLNCLYQGSKVNLYQSGAQQDFDTILDNSGIKNSSNTRTFQQISAVMDQNKLYYLDVNTYNNFQTDQNQNSTNFGENYASERKQTLFNLYAFTFSDSFQKNVNSSTLEPSLKNDYVSPTLKLVNIEFRNFLYDYGSLIHIENDNYVTDFGLANPTGNHFGSGKIGGSVIIHKSRFIDSSFTYGMLFVTHNKPKSLAQVPIYTYSEQQEGFANTLQKQMNEEGISQQRIQIYESVLENLNYGQAIYALSRIDQDETEDSLLYQSKGYAMTVYGFEGPIELVNNTISKNMAFIPSAILSNNQKFNNSLMNFGNSYFKTSDQMFLQFSKNETQYFNQFVNYFNYYDPDVANSELRDNYTTQSAIFLKEAKSKQIVLIDNVFKDNIGLSGGALHIDLQIRDEDSNGLLHYSPFVFLKGNLFERNMAYFNGNALYIRGSQKFDSTSDVTQFMKKHGLMQIQIENCTFNKNYGLNVAYGSAISIDGLQDSNFRDQYRRNNIENLQKVLGMWNLEYSILNDLFMQYFNFGILDVGTIDTFAQMIMISNSSFSENYSGFRSSSINVVNSYLNPLRIENCTFFNNTGSFSFFEKEHKLPFYRYLTNEKYTLNYFSNVNMSFCLDGSENCENKTQQCIDEISSISYKCWQPYVPRKSQSTTFLDQQLHYQYPSMKGVIFVQDVANVTITNSNFTYNDPGFVWNNVQVVGLLDKNQFSEKVIRASSIFISDGLSRGNINHNYFSRNQLYFMDSWLHQHNLRIQTYFIPFYFQHSFAPIINFFTHTERVQLPLLYQLTVFNNTFYDHYHHMIYGYDDTPNFGYGFQASLLNLRISHKNFQIQFNENIVHNMSYVGMQSSLIRIDQYGALQAKDNLFFDLGQLTPKTVFGNNIPAIPIDLIGNQSMYYWTWGVSIALAQQDGVFYISSEIADVEGTHIFDNNHFKRIWARNDGVYGILTQKLRDIKFLITNNVYNKIYGAQSSIMFINNQYDVSNGLFYLNKNPQGLGVIKMVNEHVSECSALRAGKSIYYLFSQSPFLSFIIEDSVFSNNYLTLMRVSGVTVYARNVTFTNDKTQANLANLVCNKPTCKEVLKKLNHTDKPHGNNEFHGPGHLIAPSPEQIYHMITKDNSTYEYIKFEGNTNTWNSQLTNQGVILQNSGLTSYSLLKLGDQRGFQEIFAGFEFQNQTLAQMSQMINCTFKQFHGTMFTKQILSFEKTKFYFKNVEIDNIQSKMFDISYGCQLILHDLNVSGIGTELFYYTEDIRKLQVLKHFESFLVSKKDTYRVYPVRDGYKYPSGFLESNGGEVEIHNCNIGNSISEKGLIMASDDSKITIKNNKFYSLMGFQQSAFIFGIMNNITAISVYNTTVTNTYSLSSSITLTFSKIHI